jgi:tetratricopeptide (TPR) repeat protein
MANDHLRRYVAHLLELQSLMQDGRGNAGEADAVREAMEPHWEHLNVREQCLVRHLSSDLYMLEGREIYDEVPPEERSGEVLGPGLVRAFDGHRWEELLALLRRGPAFLPPDRVAYVRARAWGELGLPEAAARFFDHAAASSPQNISYPALALDMLLRAGLADEAIGRASELIARPGAHPQLLFRAADALHRRADSLLPAWRGTMRRKVVEAIERGLHAEESGGLAPTLPSVLSGALVELGLGYESLGERDKAEAAYRKALARNPGDAIALTARGILHLRAGQPDAAVPDLERAVAQQTSLAWPYYLLAVIALRNDEFLRSLGLCGAAFDRTESGRLVAQLLVCSAAALAGSGGPATEIKRLHAEALQCDPFGGWGGLTAESLMNDPGAVVPDLLRAALGTAEEDGDSASELTQLAHRRVAPEATPERRTGTWG